MPSGPHVRLLLLGLVLAALRAHLVAAPVLPFRYYGPIEGRIVERRLPRVSPLAVPVLLEIGSDTPN